MKQGGKKILGEKFMTNTKEAGGDVFQLVGCQARHANFQWDWVREK